MFRTDKINEDLMLTQITDGLLFGTDALMLAYFLCGQIKKKSPVVVEFGTGSGVIPLLVASKIPEKIGHIYTVEIQTDYVELAKKNVLQNRLDNKITVIEGDIRKSDSFFYSDTQKIEPESVDVVFTNPPYMNNHGKMSENEYKNIAKHEILCNIEDILYAAKRILKFKSDFYCVYPCERLQYLFDAMGKFNINPKIVRFIHAKEDEKATLALVKGKKDSSKGLEILSPVFLSKNVGFDDF